MLDGGCAQGPPGNAGKLLFKRWPTSEATGPWGDSHCLPRRKCTQWTPGRTNPLAISLCPRSGDPSTNVFSCERLDIWPTLCGGMISSCTKTPHRRRPALSSRLRTRPCRFASPRRCRSEYPPTPKRPTIGDFLAFVRSALPSHGALGQLFRGAPRGVAPITTIRAAPAGSNSPPAGQLAESHLASSCYLPLLARDRYHVVTTPHIRLLPLRRVGVPQSARTPSVEQFGSSWLTLARW